MVVPSTFFHVAHNGPVHHGLVISQTWKPITYQSLWRVCLCLIGYYDFSAWSNDGHREGRITINKINRVDRGTQRSKLGRIFFLLEPTVLITMHLWYPAPKLTHSRSQDLHFFFFILHLYFLYQWEEFPVWTVFTDMKTVTDNSPGTSVLHPTRGGSECLCSGLVFHRCLPWKPLSRIEKVPSTIAKNSF